MVVFYPIPRGPQLEVPGGIGAEPVGRVAADTSAGTAPTIEYWPRDLDAA
jgi:hypothetical protein